jgi:type 1 glutamine amidotransferase/peptidoglycan/xylan/chitin deacetylase (PgdA/CDA1 family)
VAIEAGAVVARVTRLAGALAAVGAIVAVLGISRTEAQEPAKRPKRVLAVGASPGWEHESVPDALVAIYEIGRDSGLWETTVRTDLAYVTKKKPERNARNLDDYDAVFFMTCGDIALDDEQMQALLSFVRDDGKGFLGAHSATATLMRSPAYIELLGGTFDSHPWDKVDGVVRVEDREFQATRHFPERLPLFEEYYQIKDVNRARSHVLMSLDPATVDLHKKGVRGDDFPLAWTHSYGGGRVFYSALGHPQDQWARADMRQMWLEAAKWAMHIGEPTASVPAPVELTADQDHKRLLDLLGIPSLRPGANPRNPEAPQPNYDEAKATPYTSLPDPLVLKSGKRVADAKTWWEKRRPEIVEDFDSEVYGRAPKLTPAVRWVVTATTQEAVAGVPVVTKRLMGRVDNSAYPAISVEIEMSLTTPARALGPVPVMIELGFRFPAGIRLPPRPPGTPPDGPSAREQIVSKGWGYAVLYPTSIQADNGGGLTKGIIGLVNKGQPRKVDDWGALRAWGWGASRALDYLETDKAVDAKHVGIEGLSRYGKAALVTMAYDPRFALAFVASSGEGGAKLHRRRFGELVENLADSGAYHWVDGNFLKYAGPLTPNDLPVDAHELIALCAPRPVFVSSGSFEVEGGWVDAKGMFLAAAGAGPVYRLLGKKDLGTAEFPEIETALTGGEIAFRQHRGGHTAGPNWPTFLAWADRYVKAPGVEWTPKLALTFDDLPVHGPLPFGMSRADVARSILAALQAKKAPPTYGFVNAKGLSDATDAAEVLRLWRSAGQPLGNHTYSHVNLNAVSAEAFERDTAANEEALRSQMGDDGWRWLRYPFLREGETLDKRRAVRRFLAERRYDVAEVTMNFDDYAYNDPYARCLAKNDTASVDWLKQSYLRRAGLAITASQEAARRLYGRDIAHVMLLHIGGFETVMFPQLLDLLESRGFELVTLPEAQSDPAYKEDPDVASSSGATLLDQWAAVKGVKGPAFEDDSFAKLEGLCR